MVVEVRMGDAIVIPLPFRPRERANDFVATRTIRQPEKSIHWSRIYWMEGLLARNVSRILTFPETLSLSASSPILACEKACANAASFDGQNGNEILTSCPI